MSLSLIPSPTKSKAALEAERERLHAEMARRRLIVFVEKVWKIVEPTEPYRDNWHIHALCNALEAVTRGDIEKLIVNVPPGSMKSLLVSVIWPAWEWASNPSLRYFCASYGAALSIRDNLRLRQIVTSDWYMRHYGLRLTGDQNAKERFNTNAGGWRIATSVGGVGTGEHPDRKIIDDPTTADQARSDTERTSANEWYDRTVSTRGVSRKARTVVIMQRLHEEDLSGHLLARGGWHHIMWPMHFDPTRADPTDPRTIPGELFWPSLFPEARVRALEIELGPYGAAGQLEQRPAPEGGGLFKAEWFKIVDAVPAMAIRCRGWDTAASEGHGDWTCGVKMSRAGSIFYVEDVVREQLSPAGVDALIKAVAAFDGPAVRIREEQEPGSAGKTVIANRIKALVGYDYRGVPTTGDKVTRARPYRSQAEAGNVRLVRGPWNAQYLAELTVFPNGKNDDQVDGSSAAFNELALGATAAQEAEVSWG